MRLEHSPETGQVVLWTMGEAHIDVLLDRLATRYGVSVDTVPLAGRAARDVRRVVQGARTARQAVRRARPVRRSATSRSSRCRRAPASSSSTRWSADAVPRQFIPSVEKGVRAQMEKGVAAGYPVVDIRVTLVDGKAHSVDSSDMAFQMAGGLALRDAAEQSPGARCSSRSTRSSVLVDDDFVGAVMGDLSSRRGHVVGTEPVGGGGAHPGAGRGAAAGDRPVRDRPALDVARHRHVHPPLRPARPDAAAGVARRCWPRPPSDVVPTRHR